MSSCKGRLRARCIAAAIGVLGFAAAANAAPLQLRFANGLSAEIHRPEDLVTSHVTRNGGKTILVVHDRLRYELVTDVDDPVIANRGDGRFHPMSVESVIAALEGIRFLLGRSRKPLAWTGVLDDTGFQRVIPLLPEPGGTRRMERLVDREMRCRSKRLKQRHERRRRVQARRASGRSTPRAGRN